MLFVDHIFTLIMLVLLQAVLGFDNLLYISIESKRVKESHQALVRKMGIGIAIFLRIILLFLIVELIDSFQDELFSVHFNGVFEGYFNLHSLIVLFGGVFIMYTAVKEIFHLIQVEDLVHESKPKQSMGKVVFLIVFMNLIFSFDSILSAMALTQIFWIMALAIIISGVLMIWLADGVATFLEKNRMYEVLGLFILFIVGVMLLSEGGHLSHLKLLGYEITAMSKATFYFVISVLVLIDIVQARYRKKLLAMK